MPIRVALSILAVLVSQAPATSQERQDASISGRVVGLAGSPHVGATVELTDLDRDRVVSARRTTTNERGEYRFDALPKGRYTVSFDMPCHTTERTIVELEAGNAIRKDALLVRPAFISGRVLTPALEPAAKVRIEVVPADGTPPGRLFGGLSDCANRNWPESHFSTGADGLYSIHVGPGLYYIHTLAMDNGELMGTFFPGVRNKADATAIHVGEGEMLSNLDFRLEFAAPGVAIQLIGANDGTVRNMQLSYGRADSSHRGSKTGRSAEPDARGRLYIYDTSLPVGPVTVFAFADGPIGPLVAFGKADLTESQPTGLELRLGAFGTVQGRVTRTDGDAAIPDGVSVSLTPIGYVPRGHENTAFVAPAHTPFVAEGLAGYYRVEISPRTWQIRSVTDRGHVVDATQLEIQPDDALDLQIVIAPR